MATDDSTVHPSQQRAGGPSRAGDPAASAMRAGFLALLDAEYHLVVRFVMFNGAKREEALDATQAAFAQAWTLVRQRPEQWAAVRNPRAWIRTVALRNHRRPPDRRREPLTTLAADPADLPCVTEDPAELTAQTLYVLQALRALPQTTRTIMALHVDGFRPVQIAEELGITDQQARDQLKKGRRLLSPLLAGQHETPRAREGDR